MKKILLLLPLSILLLACPKNKEPEPAKTSNPTVDNPTNTEISGKDPLITKENADYFLSYIRTYFSLTDLNSFARLDRSALFNYSSGNVSSLYNNKVYLNDTIIDTFTDSDFSSYAKYYSVVDDQWVERNTPKIELAIKYGTTLPNDVFIFSNIIPDTFKIDYPKVAIEKGKAYTFKLSKIPQNIDSLYVSYSGYANRFEISKTLPGNSVNSFTISAEEIEKLISRNNDYIQLNVAAVKILSTSQKGKKIFAQFGSQATFDVPFYY